MDRVRAVLWRVFLVVLTTVLGTESLFACPQETVTYGPFTTRELRGRILPMHDEELLPGTKVTFVLHEKGRENAEVREVTVAADGRFVLGLPEGVYEFTIKIEGFLFTLVGEVTISVSADPERSIEIRPPWC